MSPLIIGILMFVALIVFLFMGHPLAFVLAGIGTVFGFFFWGPSVFPMFINRIYGTMNNFTLVAITLFVFMGNLLSMSGIADGLFMALQQIIGRVKGGLGLAVIAVCIVFAACTGIIGASVVTMALLAAPVLLKRGYDKQLTMGMIAAGGSLGILIPPSIMLVIMGDQAQLSVGKLFMSAIIPGIALGIIYMIYIGVRCGLNPKLGPPMPKEEFYAIPMTKRLRDLVIYAVPPIILILAVLGSIFTGVATPTEASGVGAFVTFLMILGYRKFTWKGTRDTIYQSAKTTTMVIIILVGASCFTGVFLGLGCGQAMVAALMGAGLSKWVLYAIMMLILMVLGMFIDWIGIVMITFPLFLPIAQTLGFDTLWFVTMMAVNLQMSFLTPPFGYALFYLNGLKLPGITLGDIYRGIVPFVFMQLIGLAVCTIFPQSALWLPSLMITTGG